MILAVNTWAMFPVLWFHFLFFRARLETMTANTSLSKSKVNESTIQNGPLPGFLHWDAEHKPSPVHFPSQLKGFSYVHIFERSTNISTSGQGHLFFGNTAISIRGNKHELKLSDLTETTAALVFCQMEQNHTKSMIPIGKHSPTV